MKWLLRAVAAAVVLVAILLGVLVFALPRLAESDAARARIQAATRSVLGSELRFAGLDFGLLPPSLVIEEPSLVDPDREGDAPLARAERIAMRVQLLPLLRRQLEVQSLLVEGLALRVVRDEQGVVALPRPASGGDAAPGDAAPGADTAAGAPAADPQAPPETSGIMLGIRTITLRDAQLVFEDRAVSPPVTWSIEDGDFTARGRSAGDPIALSGSMRVADGEVSVDGSATREGALDLALKLDGVSLASLAPYLGDDAALALDGRASADLQVRGTAADPSLEGDLDVEAEDVAVSGLRARGPLSARVEIENAVSGASGPFAIDTSRAELRYGADFVKPRGTRGVLRGRLVPDEQGAFGVDDGVLELRNLVATGSLRTGKATVLRLAAAPFELEGWEALVPALGLASTRGKLAIPELVLGGDIARARGRIGFDAVEVRPPERAPLTFTGEWQLADGALVARDAKLLVADQVFTVHPKLTGLGGSPRFEVPFETTGADSNALLEGLLDLPDRLHGPLIAKGTLRGPLGGGKPFLETLGGELDFDIQGGRIVGVSILEAALGQLGSRIAATTRERGDEKWQRFYSDDFELMAAKLRIAGGALVAEPATLRYRDYGVRLEGPVRLPDFDLDLRGALSIGPALDTELARAFGADREYVGEARELVLESVRGTPVEPKVRLAGNSVTNLAAHYLKQAKREDLKRAIEKRVGPGTGEAVDRGLDVLEGLLGGGGKR